MASAKIVFYKHKTLSDGSSPVCLQVYVKKVKRKTLFNLHSEHWNDERSRVRRSHQDAPRLNMIIEIEINRSRELILNSQIEGSRITEDDLLNRSADRSISAAFDEYISGLSYHGTVRKYTDVKNKLDTFAPGAEIKSVDISFMRSFLKHLYNMPSINSKTTSAKYVNILRTILRNEMKSGNYSDLESISFAPKSSTSNSVSLTPEEIQAIKKVKLSGREDLSRDTFLLSFYTRGSRMGDVLLWNAKNIVGDHIVYNARKTGKEYRIRIHDEIKSILDKYVGASPLGYLLPWIDIPKVDPRKSETMDKRIALKISLINRSLKLVGAFAGIQKKISTKVARHSFAYLADSKGTALSVIQKMLGHSSTTVTDSYLRSIRKAYELDDIADDLYSTDT